MSLKIVFNGAEYDSVEAMPPDVRGQYEQVLESLRQTGGDEVLSALQRVSRGGASTPRPSAGTLRPPPVIEDDQRQRGGVLRVLLWMALGAAIAWWLIRRG